MFMALGDSWLQAGLCLLVLYLVFRIVKGRIGFKKHETILAQEGLLKKRHGVLIRVRFPLIHRITFASVFLSKRRLVLFHFLTRGMILQTPLGPPGRAGKEEGRFEAEKEGLLTFRTTMRGGGRVRMHLEDAPSWLRAIEENGDEDQ